MSWLHSLSTEEIQAVFLAFRSRSVEHAHTENKHLFQLAPLRVI